MSSYKINIRNYDDICSMRIIITDSIISKLTSVNISFPIYIIFAQVHYGDSHLYIMVIEIGLLIWRGKKKLI